MSASALGERVHIALAAAKKIVILSVVVGVLVLVLVVDWPVVGSHSEHTVSAHPGSLESFSASPMQHTADGGAESESTRMVRRC